MSGGVSRDAIPSIDRPLFVNIEDAATWIDDREPVLMLHVGEESRAYPLQILTWHEIVNDRVGGIPVSVTFCPLCYSAIAFERRAGEMVLEFGVSGLLRHSDLVMYDRETESLWQQITGESIVGAMNGAVLSQVPTQIVSFGQFAEAFPHGRVLSRDTGYDRPYGQNPYRGYDDIDKRPFLFRGQYDERLAPMEKVIVVSVDDASRVYPHGITRRRRVLHDLLGSDAIVVFHADGAVSALDRSIIARSREDGSVGVFLRSVADTVLTFRYSGNRFIDNEFGNTWDITGRAIEGPLHGEQLTTVQHGSYFAFAWLAANPGAEIFTEEAD
jgi:hypothetical protein